MTLEIANSLYGYIETFYYININLLKLCGTVEYSENNCVKCVLDIIQDIPRIIPYKNNKGKCEMLIMMSYWNIITY